MITFPIIIGFLLMGLLTCLLLVFLFFLQSKYKREKTLTNQYMKTFKEFRELHEKPAANPGREVMVQELLKIPAMVSRQIGAETSMFCLCEGDNKKVLITIEDSDHFRLPGYNYDSRILNVESTPLESILNENRPVKVINDLPDSVTDASASRYKAHHYPYLLFIPIRNDNVMVALIVVARSSKHFTEEELTSVETLSPFYTYLVLNKITLLELFERHIIKSRSQLADEIQSRLLTNKFLDFEFASICMHTAPSPDVNSDYQGYYLDSKIKKVSLFMTDITGRNPDHAVQAMIMLRSLFQMLLRSRQEPQKILKIVNGFIIKDDGLENYAQAVLIQYSNENHRVYFTSAGAAPLFIFRLSAQAVEVAEGSDLALGVDEASNFATKEFIASSGDIFLTCTDGLIETMNERDQLFGKDRLIKIIKDNYYHSPENLKDKIFQELSLFRGRAKKHDDRTIVILKIY